MVGQRRIRERVQRPNPLRYELAEEQGATLPRVSGPCEAGCARSPDARCACRQQAGGHPARAGEPAFGGPARVPTAAAAEGLATEAVPAAAPRTVRMLARTLPACGAAGVSTGETGGGRRERHPRSAEPTDRPAGLPPSARAEGFAD